MAAQSIHRNIQIECLRHMDRLHQFDDEGVVDSRSALVLRAG